MSKANPKGFSNIVVAIDGSALSLKAADRAISLAKEQNAKISAVSVIKEHQSDAFVASAKTVTEYIKSQIKGAEKVLDSVRAKAERNDVRFESKAIPTMSSVPEEIMRYAKSKKADLIIMGTRGRTGFKKMLLGSVASAVLSHADCPVMVIR